MEKSSLTSAERNRLIKLLNDVGLDDSEATVYMAALGVGSRPASVIARKARLKRGQTYNVLGSLIEKGIVQQVEKNGVKHFSCSSPKALVGMLETRERELAEKRIQLEQAIPELEKLVNPNINQPRVRYYQGLDGLKTVYEGMLTEDVRDIYTITNLPHMNLFVNKDERVSFTRSWTQKRHELGIYWWGICPRSPELDEQVRINPSKERKMKEFPGGLDAELWIFGDKIALSTAKGEIAGIVVENESIASLFRLCFLELWKQLPDYQPE
jgi:predicted transcriptional regulator with HTH domain